MSKKESIDKAKVKLTELANKSQGEIFPKFEKDDKLNYLTCFIKLYKKPEKPVYKPKIEEIDTETEESSKEYDDYLDQVKNYEKELEYYETLKEIVDNLIDKDFYDKLVDFGFGSFENYKKRYKMNYLYKTEMGYTDLQGNEKRFNLYDMSMLKMKVAVGDVDENYFKEIPDWNKDIESFKDVIVPYDFSTVYLFNPDKVAVLDIRKEELNLIEI